MFKQINFSDLYLLLITFILFNPIQSLSTGHPNGLESIKTLGEPQGLKSTF